MFQQILVGCDQGPGTLGALRLASAFADLAPDTSLTLVHAYAPNAARFGRRGKVEEYDDALHGEGMRLLEELRERLPEHQRERVELLSLPVSSPAFALHELAEGRSADLIVIGPAQHGPFGRLVLGSDSVGILHGAPCAVAIPPNTSGHAHEADASRAIGPIGVAYDGSPVADAAAELAARIAVTLDRQLQVIGVAEPISPVTMQNFEGPTSIPVPPPDPQAIEDEVAALLNERVAALPPGCSAAAVALHGDPVDQLTERSAELNLLVIGSRDYGPVQHVLLGSVSRGVLDNARCPVLVVPRPAVAD
ncbi:MAG: universal stress protein [Patulibacter sp.]|nr:universal stress protein [Patulibacter sp.]